MSSVASNPKWRPTVNAKITRDIGADPCAAKVAVMFFDDGLTRARTETLYEQFALDISPGEIVAVIGPSGAGKTVLLKQVARCVRGAVLLDVEALRRCNRPAICVVPGATLAERLEILSRCGLAEAMAMVTPAAHLSGGQMYRLALGVAIGRARRRRGATLLIADEFASSLDTATGAMLCRQMRKVVSGSNLGFLVATPREQILEVLRPDRTIVKPLGEPPRDLKLPIGRRGRDGGRAGCGDPRRWRIVPGTIGDYATLGRFHYLTGPPAAHKRLYVIRTPKASVAVGGPATAALLVISPPLVNVRGRNLATGGRYGGPDRAASMDLLNREVECISRVIVHPAYRGCGLAVRLVRHALATTRAPLVEALATMGRVNPFFEKGGMTAYHIGPDADTARLISAAEAVGLTGDDVAAVEPVRKMLGRKRSAAGGFLRSEIDRSLKRAAAKTSAGRTSSKINSQPDAIAELCRRTAREYVYYLAATTKETNAWDANRGRKRRSSR